MEINNLNFSTFSTFSPMQQLQGINDLSEIKSGMFNTSNTYAPEVLNQDFRQVFSEAITNVRDTDAELAHEQYKFVTGQSEDTHSLSIAATKAQVSLELLTAIRDKTLESYNELIKMTV